MIIAIRAPCITSMYLACRSSGPGSALGDRSRRRRRRCPGHASEVEEVQQVGLCSIPRRQMSGTLPGSVIVDKAILDELDDRCMVHRNVRNIVLPRER